MSTTTVEPRVAANGTQSINLDQLCENMTEDELKLIASKSLRKLVEKFGVKPPYVVKDENRLPIACFAPVGTNAAKWSTEIDDEEFIRIAEERLASPDQKLLTPVEFIAELEKNMIKH